MSIGIHGGNVRPCLVSMRHEYWHSNSRRRLASGYRIRWNVDGSCPCCGFIPIIGWNCHNHHYLSWCIYIYIYFYIIYCVYTHADTYTIWWYHVISCDIMWYHVISGFPTMVQQPLWMLHRNGRTIGRRARCLTQGWWCAKLSGVILIIDKLSGH